MFDAVYEMWLHLGFRAQKAVWRFAWTLLDKKQRRLVYEFVAGFNTRVTE